MKYFPIFQELFESDSIIFALLGFVLAVFIGIKLGDIKKNMIGLVSDTVLYAVCELISNVHTNYMIELILLFVGTVAIGGILGFLISTIVAFILS